jgi:hypothetical protein
MQRKDAAISRIFDIIASIERELDEVRELVAFVGTEEQEDKIFAEAVPLEEDSKPQAKTRQQL